MEGDSNVKDESEEQESSSSNSSDWSSNTSSEDSERKEDKAEESGGQESTSIIPENTPSVSSFLQIKEVEDEESDDQDSITVVLENTTSVSSFVEQQDFDLMSFVTHESPPIPSRQAQELLISCIPYIDILLEKAGIIASNSRLPLSKSCAHSGIFPVRNNGLIVPPTPMQAKCLQILLNAVRRLIEPCVCNGCNSSYVYDPQTWTPEEEIQEEDDYMDGIEWEPFVNQYDELRCTCFITPENSDTDDTFDSEDESESLKECSDMDISTSEEEVTQELPAVHVLPEDDASSPKPPTYGESKVGEMQQSSQSSNNAMKDLKNEESPIPSLTRVRDLNSLLQHPVQQTPLASFEGNSHQRYESTPVCVEKKEHNAVAVLVFDDSQNNWVVETAPSDKNVQPVAEPNNVDPRTLNDGNMPTATASSDENMQQGAESNNVDPRTLNHGNMPGATVSSDENMQQDCLFMTESWIETYVQQPILPVPYEYYQITPHLVQEAGATSGNGHMMGSTSFSLVHVCNLTPLPNNSGPSDMLYYEMEPASNVLLDGTASSEQLDPATDVDIPDPHMDEM